ncbi:hypothetical protein RJT34_05686 [Clitoria ternatea]|uniref:Uncharacterized protein n=1 Tax=Clitoria ternatea TaxID=43366 RepID=A0AAN9K1D1_CLITE
MILRVNIKIHIRFYIMLPKGSALDISPKLYKQNMALAYVKPFNSYPDGPQDNNPGFNSASNWKRYKVTNYSIVI